MTTKRGRLAWLAALLLAVAGCAQSTDRGSGAPEIHPVWRSCAADGTSSGAGADTLPLMDDGFTPVAAVLCRTADQRRPGGGVDRLAVEDRATDVTALVAALRLPDGKPSNGACTADLVVPPWLALIDARGRWIRPGVPVDGCHHPRRETRAAIDGLHTTRVSSRVIGTALSDGAAESGCGQGYADMAWAVSRNDPTRTVAPSVVPTPAAPVRVCVFRVPASEQGGPKPGGQYESSTTLTAQRWAAVESELVHAGPPAACHTPASRIAVFGDGTVAELDGCRLVLVGGMVRAGSPALVGLLSPGKH